MKTSYLKLACPALFVAVLSIVFSFTTQGFTDDCDWNYGDPNMMHWAQEPDLSSRGVDVSMFIAKLADDFECISSGPINDIHIWGSFINDTLPNNGPDSLTFELSIYSDVPAQGDIFSRPGNLLWTRTFRPGEYSVLMVHDGPEDWYDPPRSRYFPDNHRKAYQYNFCIDDNPFIQEEGTIYWLVVDEVGPDDPYEADYKFGWKTTARDLRWNDNAVYQIDGYNYWVEMTYPDDHEYESENLDLAFVITGINQPQQEYDWGDAPDGASAPGYPTLSFNNGASHVIAGPWLGDDTDQPDPELNGQPESIALGDDLDIEPLFSLGSPNDDEDGVFIPPMFQGQPADITLEVNGGGGVVDAWVDFNSDMSWQISEQICSWFLPDGTHTISFIVPDNAVPGQTFARFRISTNGLLASWGSAQDGEVEDHQVIIYDSCAQCIEQQFIRGDADQDSEIDDADAFLIMDYVLSGGTKPECMDAADADDNGIVEIHDATFILHYLNGGPLIPEPFPDCGPDPTDDTLTCDKYESCLGGDFIVSRNAKWFNLPDVTENGIDIRIDSNDGYFRSIADDFECRNENLLTDVHLWCSWKSDLRGVIENIHLSIHNDDPAGPLGADPNNLFSKPSPGVLWEMDFTQDRFKETLYYTLPEPGEWWWDPINGELIEGGDRKIWRIDINIDPNVAFRQYGSVDNPRIYWLNVQVDANDGEFGWKTRRWPDHYMDDAVWDVGTELPRIWKELRYPKNHPYHDLERDSIDMAFCLTYTHDDESMPTSMPISATQCPVVATRCPTVATRCPAVNTQCPVVATQCPPLQTQCVAITMCPPTETSCPAVYTQCPVVETECPVYETLCPPAETQCPVIETQCPPIETECPPLETKCVAITTCPPTETTCPAVYTQCPIVETECPASDTRCPPVSTQCPVVYTRCPPLETECVAITTCPPTETSCPAVYTKCPVVDTECPAYETRCPRDDTRCPVVITQCPVVFTRCPPLETECVSLTTCPPTETSCPVVYTKCPEVSTECPAYETRCPPNITQCPVIYTQCPPLETECVSITTCPPEETTCPVAYTKCPIVQTECPAYETRCPPLVTNCPVIHTQCPPESTVCQVIPTECPVVITECPMYETWCNYVATQCPIIFTQCPEPNPTGSCDPPPVPPWEKVTGGIKLSSVRVQCPAIQAKCPTVIDKQGLSKVF